jgi:hypothetical protein
MFSASNSCKPGTMSLDEPNAPSMGSKVAMLHTNSPVSKLLALVSWSCPVPLELAATLTVGVSQVMFWNWL